MLKRKIKSGKLLVVDRESDSLVRESSVKNRDYDPDIAWFAERVAELEAEQDAVNGNLYLWSIGELDAFGCASAIRRDLDALRASGEHDANFDRWKNGLI